MPRVIRVTIIAVATLYVFFLRCHPSGFIMPTFNNRVISTLATVILVVSINACESQSDQQSASVKVRPVKLFTIEKADPSITRSYPGVIDAARSSELAFQVGGLIKEIHVTKAQSVNEGAKVATLDTRDFIRRVESAKATYNIAEAEYQRAVSLVKTGAIARSTLEERKSQRDVAKAQLELAEKALEDTTIYAPFTGVIATVPAKRLKTVKAGDVVVSIIAITNQQLEAKIDLPASVIATLPSNRDYDAVVILDTAPQQRIPATYSEASLEADPISQTYEITFIFRPPDDFLILPGMNATVELRSSDDKFSNSESIVSVPLAAIMSNNNEKYVWLLNSETMTVAKRQISIVDGIGETVTVTAGLASGDVIVGAGAAYLADGMKVRAWTE